jgi:Ssp1 endopeptidase immunity protein Rap1a
MRSTAIVAALLCAAFTCAASGEEPPTAMTVGDLHLLCIGDDQVSHNVCRVYILAVTQGIALGLTLADRKASRPCVPPELSAEALEQGMKGKLADALKAQPKDVQVDAAGFIAAALAGAYPCPKGSAGHSP